MSKTKRLILALGMVLIFLVGLSSCNQCWYKRYYETSDKKVLPKKSRFKLADVPFAPLDSSVIDTTVIYIEVEYNTRYGPHTLDTSYHYMRFFGDGRLYSSYVGTRMPSYFEIEKMEGGYTGYYRILNGELTTEMFTSFDCGSYTTKYAKILENGDLHFYKQKSITSSFRKYDKIDYILKRKYVGQLYSKPDW